MTKYYFIIGAFLMLVGCDKNRVFDTYESIESIGWHKDSIQEFELPIMDSIAEYNMYFNIRNSNDYPFSNLYVISTIEYPNGKNQVDTLEYEMALLDGKWLGEGGSSIKESKLWYKENFKFKEDGKYKISIAQAMRKNGSVDGITFLKGITDVGLRVEKKETP